MKPFSLSIHLFRRDLRLEDNTALIAALSQSENVLPIFIFDNRQLNHPYKGNNSFEFMVNSLAGLDGELKLKGSQLYFFKGISHEVLTEIFSTVKVDALFVNRDYTPFSRERDEAMATVCKQHQVQFSSYADALLTKPEQVHKSDGSPYTIYTPFMKRARILTVAKPVQNNSSNYFADILNLTSRIASPEELLEKSNSKLVLKGGRKEGLLLLAKVKQLNNYVLVRDLPAVRGTSLLSAHHKFGTVSIRETYYTVTNHLGNDSILINELYWRDFFTHIVFHFPHALGNAFREKYNQIEWENDEVKFEKWCKGETGFPIVDAGIRELTTTGYMHNRVRMIVASFLTKDLHIDWRWGERFFANHLVDYDPAVNNGNWQWAASTGCDAQPYFRIFNPWRQQQKFDPDCIYIKRWVPELKGLTPKEIHHLEKESNLLAQYPRPIINHQEQAEKIKQIFLRL